MTIQLAILLAALASVESGGEKHPDAALGRAGERSRYQITRAVWQQHEAEARRELAKLPNPPAWTGDFATDAADPVKSAAVGEQHLIWLCRQLEKNRQPVTVETLAGAWKSPAAAFQGHQSAGVRDYAARVGNLYADFARARTTPSTHE
jgi:hypothetical protein